MESLPRLPSLSRRRSHLDSSSYRTLARIFSHCLHLSLNKPPNPDLCAVTSSFDDQNAISDRIDETREAAEAQISGCDGKDEILQSVEESLQHDERLSDMISDLSCLIGDDSCQKQGAVSEIAGTNSFDDLNAISNRIDETREAAEARIAKFDGKDEILQSVEESLQHDERLSDMISDLSCLIGADSCQKQGAASEIACGGSEARGEVQIINLGDGLGVEKDKKELDECAKGSIQEAQTTESGDLDCTPQELLSLSKSEQSRELNQDANGIESMKESVVERAKEEPDPIKEGLNEATADFITGEFEEGEILDDAQDLNLNEDSEFEKPKEDSVDGIFANKEELDHGSVRDFNANLHDECSMSESEHEDDKSAVTVADMAGVMRRRRMTEERKAKRKKRKRIKRAEKERKEGVKRLKLQLVVKPKVVHPCKFYSVGKCQKGDQCKFSHDATPLTKSMPCTYFAKGECLNGEACPYDHDLSKYMCHKFATFGVCPRSDTCKFSHKVQDKEGQPLPSGLKKPEIPSPQNSNLGKQSNSSNNSSNSQKKSREIPVKVPKGIQFLSFGKEKPGEKKSVLPDIVADVANKAVLNPSLTSQADVACGSGKVQSEVSEASKILNEFLFGQV